MRNLAAGFFLGYCVIGLVTLPLVLSAMEIVPNYTDGVTMVLDRSGVLMAGREFGAQATHLRNQAMSHVNEYLGATIFAQAGSGE